MLTKSLHTVTAVTKVAVHLNVTLDVTYSPAQLVIMALGILGYGAADIGQQDPTVLACHKAVTKAIQS